MISIDDLKLIPELSIIQHESHRIAFSVRSTLKQPGQLLKKPIVVEVRCPLIQERLVLGESTVQLMDSDDATPPDPWLPANVEETLSHLVGFRRKLETARQADKAPVASRVLTLGDVRAKLNEAAASFVAEALATGVDNPLKLLPTFVQMATELFIKHTPCPTNQPPLPPKPPQ